MKKFLVVLGLAGIGFSFYYFFKKQLDLALDLTYNLKRFRLKNLTTDSAVVEASIEVVNRSSFSLVLKSYDLTFGYDQIPIARTASNVPIEIKSEQAFEIDATGEIDLKKASNALLPFVTNVIKKRPINLSINGYVQADFLGITQTINLDNKNVVYSNNLLSDLDLEEDFDEAVDKIEDVLGNLGINI